MLTCVWSLCSAKKLLRLWHFVSILTYNILDQLERRYCKDTQKCWLFCIGAPEGPFWQGLITPTVLVAKLAASDVDSGGKFVTGLVATGAVDTAGAPWLQMSLQKIFIMTLILFSGGFGEKLHEKTLRKRKNLVTLSP